MPSWQRRFSLDVPCPVRAPSAAHPESYPDGGTTCVLLPLLLQPVRFHTICTLTPGSHPATQKPVSPTVSLHRNDKRQRIITIIPVVITHVIVNVIFPFHFILPWELGWGRVLPPILSTQFAWHPHENVDHLRVAPTDNFMALPEGLMHLG